MKTEIKYALYLIGLGMTLIAYAHTSFATKERVDDNTERLRVIDERIYEIWKEVVKK